MTHRPLAVAAAGLAGALVLAGCANEDTRLTDLDQSMEISTDELAGREMTLTHRVEEVFGDEFLLMGDDETVVFVKEMPEGIHPGDEVRATGIVQERDAFSGADRERLFQLTDQGTANYLVDRDSEPVLTDATIVKLD